MAHSTTYVHTKRLLSVALAVMLVATLVPFQAVIAFGVTTTGTTWYVDATTGDDGGLGTEADPLETMFEAVYNRADDGDTILVKPGHYWADPLTIDGFSNLKIASTGGAAVTTLDGDHDGTSVLDVHDCDSLTIDGFTIRGGGQELGGGVYVSGSVVKLTNSVVTDNGAAAGGGLYSNESTVTVEGCEFTENYADWDGAGLCVDSTKLTVKDCEFTDNGERYAYDLYGGGVALYFSQAVISGTTFDGNVAETGGGLLGYASDADLFDNVFTGNEADSETEYLSSEKSSLALPDTDASAHRAPFGATTQGTAVPAQTPVLYGAGGGAALYEGEYTVSGTEFTDNSAYNSGAGLHADLYSSAKVSDCTFEGNSAFLGAAMSSGDLGYIGKLVTRTGSDGLDDLADARTTRDVDAMRSDPELTLEVERSVFVDNESFSAPVLYLDSPGLTSMTNCLIEGNSGGYSGAIEAYSWWGETDAAVTIDPIEETPVTMTMANCTLANNIGVQSISLYGEEGSWDVRNTAIWGNTTSGWISFQLTAVDAVINAPADFTYCDLQYGYMDADTDPWMPQMGGTGNFSKNPQFAADFNLTSGSPCIDTGTEEGAPDEDIDGWTRPMDGDSDGLRAWDVGAYEYYDEMVRDVGSNRYVTAVKACQQHFDSADTVIVATGEVFADGLSAAGLAGSYEAPILLSPHAEMPALVKTEIKRLGASHAIVIGGENALSATVMSGLKSMGLSVERIGGVNRYSTAALIARKVAAREGDDFSGVGFVARGDTFPDALSISPIAYAMKSPILLVKPDSLPSATVDVIEAVDFDEFFVAGGPDAVSSMAVNGLAADTVQIGGIDRYDTSAKVSDYAAEKGWAQMTYTGIATGENFPDALTGGAALGAENGVLLLTPYKALHSSPKFLMEKRADEVKRVEVLGGEAAVSDAVWDTIANILK